MQGNQDGHSQAKQEENKDGKHILCVYITTWKREQKRGYSPHNGWDKKLSSVLHRLSEDGQLCLPASVNKEVCQRVKTRCQDDDHTAIGLFSSVLEDQRMTLLAPTHKFFTCLVDG